MQPPENSTNDTILCNIWMIHYTNNTVIRTASLLDRILNLEKAVDPRRLAQHLDSSSYTKIFLLPVR